MIGATRSGFCSITQTQILNRFGTRCLAFEDEVRQEHLLHEKHEADALRCVICHAQRTCAARTLTVAKLCIRVIAVFVNAWKMARNPPPHIVSDTDHKRWQAVCLFHLLVHPISDIHSSGSAGCPCYTTLGFEICNQHFANFQPETVAAPAN